MVKNRELPDCLELASDKEIRKCQKDFADAFKKAGEQKQVAIGYQGGHDRIDTWWFGKYKFWWAYVKAPQRHWNAFGIGDSEDRLATQDHNIVCEINPPVHADNQRTTGRFCKDGDGRYYVAHTGRFNASGKRIRLDNFESWPNARICETGQPVWVVSALDDKKLVENVGEFVKTVQTIKKMSKALSADDKEEEEFSKALKKTTREEIVNDLKKLGPKEAKFIKIKGKTYKRDNKTTAQLKQLRHYKCQICQIKIPKKGGGHYIEAAHIKSKRQKGPETPDNIMILCPNHHKEFDHGDTKITEHTKKEVVFEMNGKEYQINLEVK